MKRRTFIFGSLGALVYVACGSDSNDSDEKPGADGGVSEGGGGPAPDASAPLAPTSPPEASDKRFPQGLASGDPRPDRVVLWTRVDATAAGKGAKDDVELEFVLAKDEALTEIVARGKLTAEASADHTVRLIPTGLEPGRHYYYRFEAAGVTTRVARTKTAPVAGADVPVRFAFTACQDFIGRYYHSWRALIEEKPDLDFVMYLGDYIYESVNDQRFQSTTPERAIKLPDGLDTSPKQDKSRIAAGTLADYRAIYKAYKSDAFLREVHRLYPFVIVWDDHEFADDCWQDHSTSFNGKDPISGGPLAGDEKNTVRRTAANRAFFEFQPIDVPYRPSLSFPEDIQIYRQLTFGKHVDLFLTDQRSYRADHLVPEGEGTDLGVGKFTNYTMIGSRYFVRKSDFALLKGFDTKEAAAKPSLLGAKQKAWLLDAMKRSKATWKVWGNEVSMYEMKLDIGQFPLVPDQFKYVVYLNADQWDGYRSERAEILGALADAKVDNLVVCTGDIHSFHASELHVDFSAPKAKPVGVEYVSAGISSSSLRGVVDKMVPSDQPLLEALIKPIADSWVGAADGILTSVNAPYLKYADTDAYGFVLMTVDATKTEAVFVQLGDPTIPTYGGIVARTKFVTQVGTNKVTKI